MSPPAAQTSGAPLPLDAVVLSDRRSAARFQPVATTDLARTLAALPPLSAPPAHPLLAAAGIASPPAAAALRIASDLESRGFQLLVERRLWIPFLMDRYVELTPAAFARMSDEGCTRLAVGSPTLRPSAVRSLTDLQALDAFYLGGAAPAGPAASLVASLGSLYRSGFTFQRADKGDVGPYGAWTALQDGQRVSAGRYGEAPVSLTSELDAARLQFFRAGGSAVTLPHVDEARTLLDLEEKQNATLWTDERAVQRGAEGAWKALFQDGGDAVWAGDGDTPLVRLTGTDLLDPAGVATRVHEAVGDHRQLMAAGVDPSRGRAAWLAVSPPVAGEPFRERLAVFTSLVTACGGDDAQALDAWTLVRQRVGAAQPLAAVAARWCEVRSAFPRNRGEEAAETFVRLEDHLDEAAPGVEPPQERRRLFLEMLHAVQRSEYTEALWRAIWTADPKADQVDTFLALLKLEHGSGNAAEADYRALAKLRAPGERLGDLLADFASVRRFADDEATAVSTFELQRRRLAQTAPGPQTDEARKALFSRLLTGTKSCAAASAAWIDMGKAGPATELEARLRGWVSLFSAEREDVAATSACMRAVLDLRTPGEPVEAAVAAFVDVRSRLREGEGEKAVEAFRFVRDDLTRSLPGPWSSDEKKALYLSLLSAHGDHAASLRTWHRLAGRDVPPADFPERVKTFVTLLSTEHEEAQARKTFDLLLAEQRAGEALPDTLKAFVDVRRCLPSHDPEAGRAAFRFVRGHLSRTLPGPWTDEQRAAMYLPVLEACRSQETAVRTWDALVGGKGHPYASADFPARLASFQALHAYEGDIAATMSALVAVDDMVAARPGEKADDLVKAYLQLRPLTGNSADEGIVLLQRVHFRLTPAEAACYLRLQTATRSLHETEQLWATVLASRLEVGPSTDLMCESLSKSRYLPVVLGDFEAVRTHLRDGETVAQGAAALQAVRKALPPENVTEASTLFTFMRTAATPAREPLFLSMVKRAGTAAPAMEAWRALKQAGPEASFELRTNLVLAQPPKQWPAIIGRMRSLEASVPAGVDRPRALAALLRVAALPDASAVKRVSARLEATPGADRTAALEWLCGVMTAAGDVEGFEQAWGDVHRAGVAGTPAERQALFGRLLESTRRSEDGFDASLDFMRCLDRVAAAAFPSAAASAVALAGAMQGHAGDAQRAFEYIVDARAGGAYASETLDATLTRFATHYAASRSVETALSRLGQGTSGGGRVERQDGDVIIGGIRVPRAKSPRFRRAV